MFKVGDVVQLKSGSLPMTVHSVDEAMKTVKCIWPGPEGRDYCTSDLPLDTIMLACLGKKEYTKDELKTMVAEAAEKGFYSKD